MSVVMGQVERLRSYVRDRDNVAVQSMSTPAYIRTFLADTESTTGSSVVLVYRLNSKTSASSLPFSPEEESETDLDVTGHPLESPFKDENFDEDTVISTEKFTWAKSELNHFPIQIQIARSTLNAWNEAMPLKSVDEDGNLLLDIWLVTYDGSWNVSCKSTSINDTELDITNCDSNQRTTNSIEASTVLFGCHCVDNWFSRTIVKAQECCSISSPSMDPNFLKQKHLKSSHLPESKVRVHVLCWYTIDGNPVIPEMSNTSSADHSSSVLLELEWNKLSVSVPLETATAKLVTQVRVGHHSSPAYSIWKQLNFLQKLLDLLLVCWRDKKAPTLLPHEQLSKNENSEDSFNSLKNKLERLIRSGGSELLSEDSTTHGAVSTKGGLGRRSVATGFLGRRSSIAPKHFTEGNLPQSHPSLIDAVATVTSGNRENSDITDSLWNLLRECRTCDDLANAWTLVFSEFSQGYSKPYIHPKNKTKAAKLLSAIISGHEERGPDFYTVQGCGIFEPLELLVELGLQKVATDFYYIFLDSESVSRDCLVAPELLRNDLTVSRDKWLSSCGSFLGWLAQLYTSLEVTLALLGALPHSDVAVSVVAPLALKHFQSDTSPVRSVSGLLSFGLQRFSCVVSTKYVQQFIHTKDFDVIKLTLTSESDRRKVRTVFLRNRLHPIFPPQIYGCDEIKIFNTGESSLYYCAEGLTVSDLICS